MAIPEAFVAYFAKRTVPKYANDYMFYASAMNVFSHKIDERN